MDKESVTGIVIFFKEEKGFERMPQILVCFVYCL